MSCVLGNSIWRHTSKALSAFSTACCAWNADTKASFDSSFNKCRLANRSALAFDSHSRTNSDFTSSGDFIDHLAVFMRRIGDAADDVLCFLKSLRWHDDYVEGEAQTRKSATNPIRHFPKMSQAASVAEKLNVAVACHRSGRCRTKHDNAIGLRNLQNALNDLPRYRIVQARTCSIILDAVHVCYLVAARS